MGLDTKSWLIIQGRVWPVCLNLNQPLYYRKHIVNRNQAIFHLCLSSGLRNYEFPMAQYTLVTFKKKGLVNLISHMIHYWYLEQILWKYSLYRAVYLNISLNYGRSKSDYTPSQTVWRLEIVSRTFTLTLSGKTHLERLIVHWVTRTKIPGISFVQILSPGWEWHATPASFRHYDVKLPGIPHRDPVFTTCCNSGRHRRRVPCVSVSSIPVSTSVA